MSAEVSSIEKLREKDRFEEILRFIKLSVFKIAPAIFLAFWFIDWLFVPQKKWELLVLRFMLIPYSLIFSVFLNKVKTIVEAQILGTALVLFYSINLTLCIFVSGDVSSPYYASLNFITIIAIAFVPWSKKFLVFNILIIYGPFYFVALVFYNYFFGYVPLIINSFFIVGTVVISTLIRYFTEKLRKSEVVAKYVLEKELKYREKIIQQKTQEALKLENLTKQFSPQVAHYILKEDKLKIVNQVHRAQICAIFIDIVDFAERIVRVDKDDANKVITMFLDESMEILLKYDITLDKFLGSGILAFSNDPVAHDDYVERVLQAAIEIKEKIRQNEETYIENWLNVLQIRIGISSGIADVGFYGTDETFQSYTAIGQVVNLAARLCYAAEPDQIVISEDIKENLPVNKYEFERIGEKPLKGFEGKSISIYGLIGYKEETFIDTNVRECPNGHGILHLDSNEKGIYVFKCRTCNYQQSL
ncbi:MAG: adenylate/guanylate cyclase domain-containing protein [Pseudomonadota bacterium]